MAEVPVEKWVLCKLIQSKKEFPGFVSTAEPPGKLPETVCNLLNTVYQNRIE